MILVASWLIGGEQPEGDPRPADSAKPQASEWKQEFARLREQIERLASEVQELRKAVATQSARQPAPQPPAVPPAPRVLEPAREVQGAASQEGSQLPALKVEEEGAYAGGFGGKAVVGWEFDVAEAVTIKELGVWDSDSKGLDVEIPVGIWDPSGKLVASATVPAGDKARMFDQFRYVTVEPYVLKPRQRYVIGALYGPHTKEHVIDGASATRFSTPGPIRWLRGRRGKTETLALPESSPTPAFGELLGAFGPNFLIAKEPSMALSVRTYYRTREVQSRQWQTISVPEKPDGSHKEDKTFTVSLFALPDGKLTQVLLDDVPLGTGDIAFTRVASELERVNPRQLPNRATVRVAAMPSVTSANLQAAMNVATEGRFHFRNRLRSIRGGEVSSLYAARLKQPSKDGKFVAPDRFRDAGDYIEDRWTGLLWQKDGTASGKKNFYQAADYAKELELGGLKGWRVPKIDELATIFPATFAPFSNSMYIPEQCCRGPNEFATFWTSELDLPTPDYAFVYQWYDKGGANNCFASKNYAYVRCVHDPLAKQADARD